MVATSVFPVSGSMPPRLLVVDDDAEIVKLVSIFMRSRGYLVDGATTLTEAIAAIDTTAYAVVLTDKNLKGATGLELIDALTLKAPTTAIVLMTAYPKAPSAGWPRSMATWASRSSRSSWSRRRCKTRGSAGRGPSSARRWPASWAKCRPPSARRPFAAEGWLATSVPRHRAEPSWSENPSQPPVSLRGPPLSGSDNHRRSQINQPSSRNDHRAFKPDQCARGSAHRSSRDDQRPSQANHRSLSDAQPSERDNQRPSQADERVFGTTIALIGAPELARQGRSTSTRSSVKSAIAYRTPSRPRPESFTPP